jgi:hypothetical protein
MATTPLSHGAWRSGLQSYDIDRFGMIISTTEDGLHADQS